MDPWSALAALTLIHLLAVASPGPAFIAVVQVSATGCRRIGLYHALGLGAAATVWAAGSVIGLQSLMLRVANLYQLLQLVGGIYLIYVGIHSWRNAKNPAPQVAAAAEPSLHGWEAFRQGFATNIANPKVMVFFAGIFATVLDPRLPAWVSAVALIIVAINEVAWPALLSIGLSTKASQSAYRRGKSWIDRIGGAFMMFFGGRLVWSAVRQRA